jgi:predicted nuclease with TOPRIM domain
MTNKQIHEEIARISDARDACQHRIWQVEHEIAVGQQTLKNLTLKSERLFKEFNELAERLQAQEA